MKHLVLALSFLSFVTSAVAADLTTNDKAYLNERFGVKDADPLLQEMPAVDRATIHDLIVEPWTAKYPGIRDARVQSKLYDIYYSRCSVWRQTHSNPQCPPTTSLATSVAMQAGKDIADMKCNMCHLFGTADTPPFFALARSGGFTETRLTSALAGGHRMSPITLAPREISDLFAYVSGLK